MPRSTFAAALLLTLPALASIAGCSSDLTEAARVSQNAQFTQVPEQLPFAGRCETSFVFTGPTTLQIASVCQLRGIGRVTGVAQQTLDFSQVAQTGLIGITNVSTYTAPNGDELFASFVGTGSQDGVSVSFVGIETYAGGTGRFSQVAGSAELVGAANLATSTGSFTISQLLDE